MQLDAIYNEDCLLGMQRIRDCSIDCIISDLPYGTTQNHWDSLIALEPLWEQYKRVAKKSAAIVLTAQIPFSVILAASNLAYLKYEWIWQKTKPTGFLNARRFPLKSHENILVFCFGTHTYNPQKIKATPYRVTAAKKNGSNYGQYVKPSVQESDERFPTTVLRFGIERGLHPTQKPVALFEYLIRTYTNEGETVLDNCMGAATTAIACLNTGRHYIGFEKDTGYFEIGQKRIATHQPKLPAIAAA